MTDPTPPLHDDVPWPHPGPVRMFGLGDVDWEDLLPHRAAADGEPRAVVIVHHLPASRRETGPGEVVLLGRGAGRPRRAHVDEAIRAIREATGLAA
ncbi:MAG: hypothetical protein AB1416_07595 [Actinomycetota bacterium]